MTLIDESTSTIDSAVPFELIQEGGALVGQFKTARDDRAQQLPLDVAVRNMLRSNPCHAELNTLLDKTAQAAVEQGQQFADRAEGRSYAMGLFLSHYHLRIPG